MRMLGASGSHSSSAGTLHFGDYPNAGGSQREEWADKEDQGHSSYQSVESDTDPPSGGRDKKRSDLDENDPRERTDQQPCDYGGPASGANASQHGFSREHKAHENGSEQGPCD